MTGLPKGDFNMPPGVRAADIPGNRPEDENPECPHCGYELSGDRDDYSHCPSCNCPFD